MLALAGVVDNVTPRGVLTGRPRKGEKVGLGPTVETLATITRMSRRWAGETLRWLSQPISDVDGEPLDLRGAVAPGGGRVPHAVEVVFHNPFVLVAGGGIGGGRRNQIWLHPSFYEGTDEEFDMLEELKPWPYNPNLNGNSVPIQTGTGKTSEWELSSQKPEESNTARAAPPGEEPMPPPDVEMGACASEPEPERAGLADRAGTVEGVEMVGYSPSFSSPGGAAPAVLDLKEVRGDQVRHSICRPEVSARDQFTFLVQQLAGHGVSHFDLMAPDRVLIEKSDGAKASKNSGWRWTFRDSEGRRQNTAFREQAAFNLDAEQVLVEFDRSLPAILADRVGARSKPTLGRDFYWRAARHRSWPLIVLDDVDVTRLPACRQFVLQTSEHKFQALLLCDEALDDDERHALQSYYVSQKICDPGASGGIQPVRPPGSINRKPERDSFVTRLVDVQLDAPLLCVKEVREQLAAARPPVPADRDSEERTNGAAVSGILGRRSGSGAGCGGVGVRLMRTDDSASADDMSAAMRMLKSRAGAGSADAAVLAWLVNSAMSRGKKSDARSYAATTLASAKHALAHNGQLPETPRRAARRARG